MHCTHKQSQFIPPKKTSEKLDRPLPLPPHDFWGKGFSYVHSLLHQNTEMTASDIMAVLLMPKTTRQRAPGKQPVEEGEWFSAGKLHKEYKLTSSSPHTLAPVRIEVLPVLSMTFKNMFRQTCNLALNLPSTPSSNPNFWKTGSIKAPREYYKHLVEIATSAPEVVSFPLLSSIKNQAKPCTLVFLVPASEPASFQQSSTAR